MLKDLIGSGFGNDEMDLSCSEKILYGANKVYNLGISKDALKMSAGFAAGMGTDNVCGALTGGLMVLSKLFVEKNAHGSLHIFEINKKFFDTFTEKMGHINCAPLKENYRTEELKCHDVILKAAEVLDSIIAEAKSTYQ